METQKLPLNSWFKYQEFLYTVYKYGISKNGNLMYITGGSFSIKHGNNTPIGQDRVAASQALPLSERDIAQLSLFLNRQITTYTNLLSYIA